MKSTLIGSASLLLVLSVQAMANDSTAELAAGGLVMTKNEVIALRSEDLFLSAETVRVNYRFVNTASQDVTVRVAFPLPDITVRTSDDNLGVPTDNPTNLLGFRTLVDGTPVTAELEQQVIKNGKDRTALLREFGIPLAPHLAATNQALDRLPTARQEQLLRLGLAIPDDYDVGKGMEHHLAATWTLKSTYSLDPNVPGGA